MENRANDYQQSIKNSAAEVRLSVEQTAEQMALDALSHLDAHYERSMSEGVALWLQEKCDPAAIEAIGKQSATFVKTGKRQAVREIGAFSVIFWVCGGISLWVIAAPIWAFFAAIPVSTGFALGFALSGNDRN